MLQSNIIVDEEGKSYLADFGLSAIVAGAHASAFTPSDMGGSVRWAPLEFFCSLPDNQLSTVTMHGDIYSFGSVMLQVRHVVSINLYYCIECKNHRSDTIRTTAISSLAKGWAGSV